MTQEHEHPEVHAEAQSISTRWCRAFEQLARRRQEALPELVALYADDFLFEDPMQTLRGRTAFEKFNRRLLGMVRDISVTVKDVVDHDDAFFATWTLHFTPRLGLPFTFEGASHLRVRGGKIVYQRDYFDLLGSLASPVPAVPRFVRSAISRLSQEPPAQQLAT